MMFFRFVSFLRIRHCLFDVFLTHTPPPPAYFHQAIFCWTCSLAQLERETCTSISALPTGNPKDVPLASQQVLQQPIAEVTSAV